MSLFKILRGDSSRLDSQQFHDGYAYFTPDDGGFYIDAEVDDEQKRIKINDTSDKQDLLTAGDNVTIEDNIISVPINSGVYTGDEEPTSENVNVWIKPNGEASPLATQMWVNERANEIADEKIDKSLVFHNNLHGYPVPYWKSMLFNNRYVIGNFSREYTTQLEAKRDNGTCYSAPIYLTTPYPVKSPVFDGSTDRYGLIISSGDFKRARSTSDSNDCVKFYVRLDSLRNTDYNKNIGDDITAYLRMSIRGEKAIPPANPTIDYTDGTVLQNAIRYIEQAQGIAQSYVDAEKAENKPLSFTYGANILTGSPLLYGASEHGATGLIGGRMECDTFIQMILHGIDYIHSPWYLNWSNPLNTTITFDYNRLAECDNKNNYGWVAYLLSQLKNNPYLGRDVKFDAEIAWLLWGMDETNDNIPEVCVFSDKNQAYAGDFAFVQNDAEDTFDNISHVAFIGLDETIEGADKRCIYEVSWDVATHRNAVYKRAWNEDYPREFSYFARLNYAVLNSKGVA